jgi:RimJ/RimL family protein N-acetyltransferase
MSPVPALVAPFESERLVLRQWSETDRAPFASLCADPEVMKFFVSSVIDRTTADLRIDKWSKLIEENGWGFWAIEVKKERKFIGFAGLQRPTDEHPFAPCVEVGWRLSRSHWGHGYATEAAKRVLGIAFEVLELPEVIATTAAANLRSSAVMERIGMRGPETVFRFLDVPKENPLGDHVLYRLSRGQWQGRNDA